MLESTRTKAAVSITLFAVGVVGGCADDGTDSRNGAATPDCTTAPRGERPSAAQPDVPNRDREFLIDLEQWGIRDDGTAAAETTDGINAALTAVHFPLDAANNKPTHNQQAEGQPRSTCSSGCEIRVVSLEVSQQTNG